MTASHSRHNYLLLLFIGLFSVVAVHAITCPSGQTAYGLRCFKVYRPSPKCPKDFSFDAANAFCKANGGSLASISNSSQNDFITSLIKKGQKEHDKADKCNNKCKAPKKDYFYWIGLQLDHSANGSINGSSWTDGLPVTYGNPLSSSFRPPFVTGRPEGSEGDGTSDSEVCPLGHTNDCVAIYGFGSTVGKWTDKKCNDTHEQEHKCSCEEETSGNSTDTAHHHHDHKHSSSSDESSEDEVDECRDEAALNGFVCQYCPTGWTMFQGRCYKAVLGPQTTAQYHATCAGLGATVVSIHNTAENQFVAALASAANPANTANFIGLALTHTSLLFNAPVNSAAWSDGSPVNYGNPTVAPWSTPGNYPWAPNAQFPAQPDNRPPPGNCVLQWLQAAAAAGSPPTTWDDANCPQLSAGSTVCKL